MTSVLTIGQYYIERHYGRGRSPRAATLFEQTHRLGGAPRRPATDRPATR